MRLVVAATGASGADLSRKVIERLPETVTAYTIVSENARVVMEHESNKLFDEGDIAAPVASGSFPTDAMIIAPCSMNTLAKIACGISDNLTTRAAAVMIKERRPLLLAPRELPFSAIALENMLKLSRLGVIIAPPVIAYYSGQTAIGQMEDFIVGKWFDLLGIEHSLYRRWRIEES
ncbi:UbiX family decarboxylase associated with menaquinone via futalosine [Hydrogenimonas sp.]|nr:UbiX family decarboxylase associated with menaquinone via futalosine [Hydrogenimonas sp.]